MSDWREVQRAATQAKIDHVNAQIGDLTDPAPSTTVGQKLTQEEPVLALSVLTALLGLLGTVLVGHGVIGTARWTSLTNTILPLLALAVPVGLGWLARQTVFSPATVKKLTDDLVVAKQKAIGSGLLTDADFARLEAVLTDLVDEQLTKLATPKVPGVVGEVKTPPEHIL